MTQDNMKKDWSARIPWKWLIGIFLFCFVALGVIGPFLDPENKAFDKVQAEHELRGLYKSDLKAENDRLKLVVKSLAQDKAKFEKDPDGTIVIRGPWVNEFIATVNGERVIISPLKIVENDRSTE